MSFHVKSTYGIDTSNTAVTPNISDENTNINADDQLRILVHTRNQSDTITETSSEGWTAESTSSDTRGTSVVFKKKSTGTENDPTFTIGGTASPLSWCFSILRGIATTSETINTTTASGADDDITMPTVATTGNTNAIVLMYITTESRSKKWHFGSSVKTEINIDTNAGGTESGITMAWYVQQDATATTEAIRAICGTTATDYTAHVIALKNDGNNDIKGQCDPAADPSDLIHYCFGNSNGFYSGDLNSSTRKVDPTALIAKLSDPSTGTTTAAQTNKSLGSVPFYPYNGTNPSFVSINPSSGPEYDTPTCTSTLLDSAHPLWNSTGIDISNSVLHCVAYSNGTNLDTWANDGAMWVFFINGDFTNGAGASFRINAKDTVVDPSSTPKAPLLFDTTTSSNYETHTVGSGSLDLSNANRFGIAARATDSNNSCIAFLNKMSTLKMIGGSSTYPCDFEDAAIHTKKVSMFTVQDNSGQSKKAFLCSHNFQIGGSMPVYWKSTGQSVEYPSALSEADLFVHSNIDQGSLSFSINAASTDTIDIGSTQFNMGDRHNWFVNASSNTSATYVFGGAFIVGGNITSMPDLGSGKEYDGMTFAECSEITYTSGATFKNCVFDNTYGTQQITVNNETEWIAVAQNANTFKNHARAILINGNQSGTWSTGTVDLTVSGNTVDVAYNGTTNFTIQSAVSLTKSDLSSGVLTFDTPTDDLTVTSDTAGTLLQIFTSGTQTVLDSTTGTSLVYTHSGETVDIVAQKAGYLPQRQTANTLSGDETVAFIMSEDPVYNASHGLTFTTDYSYDPATRIMTIVANQEGRDLYSAMIDDFISETSLRNVPFPLFAVGPDRIDFKAVGKYDSTTTVGATIDSGDIQFWKGAGMEWEHDTTGNATKKFYSIKSSNSLQASTVVGYTQTNAGTTVAATLVSNKVNEVIQFYEDTNGDGTADYDYSSHLLFKGFLTGYYQARWDVINDGGATTLEPYEYTISLIQDAISGTTGDQSVTITTLTDHTSSPTTVGGKSFDYELVDPATTDNDDLLAQLNYDVYNAVNTSISGTLYTSYQAFDLPDLIIEEGSNYATEAGYFEGDGLVTDRSGVYVSRASADHPGIARFQSNDLTYYTPQTLSTISISGMPTTGANIRLQFINTTAISASSWAASTAYSVGDKVLRTTGVGTEQTAGLYMVCTTAGTSNDTEPTWDTTVGNTTADTNGTGAGDVVWTTYAVLFYDQDPGAASIAPTYIDGEEFATGDAYEIRFAELDGTTSFKSYQSTGVIGSTGATIVVSVTADSVYASNAIDGSSTAVTNIFTANYSSDYIVLDMNLDFTHPKAFAFYCYELTTSEGMYNFWGGVTAIDAGNYLNNVGVVDIMFDETTGDFVKQEDSDTSRWYRSDGTRPYRDPTTGSGGSIGGIAMNWKNPVYTISTGSVLTAGEKAQLTAIETSTSGLTYTVANKVDANTQYMNDAQVTGDGSSGDKWRGV